MTAALSRRSVLVGAGCVLVARAADAHTPYKQWDVYRRKHLLIGTCRADPESYPLGQRLVAILAESLPDSKARVTRAPNQHRLASLLTTGQLEIVVFKMDEAAALAEGHQPFAEFGPFPVRLLFELDGYALVSGDELPARHAWLITEALAEQLPRPNLLHAAVAVHQGSSAFLTGRPQPD